jgi:ribosomal protein L37AE/L43A
MHPRHFEDELHQPNTAPGVCPECGMDADIWDAVDGHWECCFCSWKGRHPKPKPHSTEEQP